MRTALKKAIGQSASRYFCLVALVFGSVLMLVLPGSAQAPPSMNNNGSSVSQRFPQIRPFEEPRPVSPATAIFEERRLQALNAAQHKAVVDDTDKLVKLVAELNKEISSSNARSLTPQQLQMVAEIEKLAHNVRDKMRMTIRTVEMKEIMPMSPFSPR